MLRISAKTKFLNSAGFTIVELVAVIIVLGILAAVGIPKFFNVDSYSGRAAYDELSGALRYGQKLAVASGCPVHAQVTASGYVLQQFDGCSSGSYVTLDDNHPLSQNSFADIPISPPVTIDFDAMGRSSVAATISIAGRSIAIVAETGYVGAP